MKDTIKIIRKKPGCMAEWIELPNRLEDLQREVGGYIEILPITDGSCLICNEEGKLQGLPENVYFRGDVIVGTILIAGTDGEELDDLPFDDIAARVHFPSLFREVTA